MLVLFPNLLQTPSNISFIVTTIDQKYRTIAIIHHEGGLHKRAACDTCGRWRAGHYWSFGLFVGLPPRWNK